MAVRVLVFDVFGTLVDWRTGIAAAFREAGVPGDAGELADAWRARYRPILAEVNEKRRAWANFDDLHRVTLDDLLTERGLTVPDDQRGPLATLSLTNATESGTTYTAEEIGDLATIAGEHGAAVHLDGARFANALVATGTAPADLTWRAGVDLMSFGGTKNGCWAAEAIVVFDPAAYPELPVLRQRGLAGDLRRRHGAP